MYGFARKQFGIAYYKIAQIFHGLNLELMKTLLDLQSIIMKDPENSA
jgi:hypothetical protein